MDPEKPFWTPWPMKRARRVKAIDEPAEYRRTQTLNLKSTIAVDEWCDFFKEQTPIETMVLAVKCPQRLFEAACQQKQLTSLYIHWGPIQDLSAIKKLKNLERLYLGSCSITDLQPISALKNMQHLSLQNLDRMSDYSALAQLKQLQYLQIDGAPFMPKKVWIDDLQFIRRLPNLLGLSMAAVRFRDPDYFKSFKNLRLECLDYWPREDDIRAEIIKSLPKLRHGRVLKER